MPMPGTAVVVAPGTPNSTTKVKSSLKSSFNSFLIVVWNFQDVSGRLKIVVALYPFKAIETGDLSLEKVKINFLIC
jgi:hypothetical protein